MTKERHACLAIGISNAGGGLDYLGGAVTGAVGMHEWAQAMGYESVLLVDELPDGTTNRVDIESIKQALLKLLPRGSATDRFILYFAGHGLLNAADNGLWLQSGWQEDKRAVAAEVLRRRLREFGVKQITLIADACRKLPPDMDYADLTQDGVLGSGFDRPRSDPAIDRFTATQDGLAAFMIPGSKAGEPDRCVFSGVLLEGLWGQSEEAFSRRAPGKVISQSLAEYLRKRVPEVAEVYGVGMNPQTATGFPEASDIYFDRSAAPPAPPMVPWPQPPKNDKLESALKEATLTGGGDAALIEVGLKALGDGKRSGSDWLMDAFRTDAFPATLANVRKQRWRDLKHGRAKDAAQLGPTREHPIPWLVERERERLAETAIEARARTVEENTLNLIQSVTAAPGRDGLVVGGGHVVRLWAAADAYLERVSEFEWRPFFWHSMNRACQVILEFTDETYGACVVMPRLLTRVAKDETGIAAIVMQPAYNWGELDSSVAAAEVAIARLASRQLEVNEAVAMATKLRMQKHANPVLGVISAYLYDAIGDQESIRRMAYFYLMHDQAIPYDVAFLADLWSQPADDGSTDRVAIVPKLNEREPRRGEENLSWTTCETHEVQGRIAGHIPWMRRGWPFISGTLSDPESLLTRILGEGLDREVASSTFTTLSARGGAELIRMLNLKETR